MHSILKYSLLTLSLLVVSNSVAGGACIPIDEGKLQCTITTLSDCEALHDYPYARNLFCPAAFSAVQTMVSRLAKTLGVKMPTKGFFYYYQTIADPQAPPDDQAQTTIACLDTPAPYPGSSPVVGAGIALCHLVAYVTSPGPVDAGSTDQAGNPVPAELRTYPSYFSNLYSPAQPFLLKRFRTGAAFDPLVKGLGSSGHDGFVADYPKFSLTKIYDPDNWGQDANYHGISGGGGGGWGAEIAILGANATLLTQLAFGGGGGGGMTSFRKSRTAVPSSVLGAGGGGGMQFANAYQFRNQHYNGLGLGAGVGSNETEVQYSYNDYEGSGNPPLPVHQYNPEVIAEYRRQLKNLKQQLKDRFGNGETILLMGGGGMGAGTEYLRRNKEEYEPHALSTQAGFQFSYEFQEPATLSDPGQQAGLADLSAQQQDFYELLGDDYRTATRRAYQDCGRDYSNYACMCPRTHAIVICLAGQQIGDPKKIPSWLQQQQCSDDSAPTNQGGNGLTSYQQLLLDAANHLTVPAPVDAKNQPCTAVLLDYFISVNSPVDVP